MSTYVFFMGGQRGKPSPNTGICLLNLASRQVELPTKTVTSTTFSADYNLYWK